MTLGKVQLKVLKTIYARPGANTCVICRILNGKALLECRSCNDRVNKWARKGRYTFIPKCWPRLGSVKKACSSLKRKGLVRGEKVRAADPFVARGWDLVNQWYPTA